MWIIGSNSPVANAVLEIVPAKARAAWRFPARIRIECDDGISVRQIGEGALAKKALDTFEKDQMLAVTAVENLHEVEDRNNDGAKTRLLIVDCERSVSVCAAL